MGIFPLFDRLDDSLDDLRGLSNHFQSSFPYCRPEETSYDAGVDQTKETMAERNDYPRFKGFPDVGTYLAIQDKLNPQKVWSRSGIVGLGILFPVFVIFKVSIDKSVPLVANIAVLLATGGLAFGAYWIGTLLRERDRRKR